MVPQNNAESVYAMTLYSLLLTPTMFAASSFCWMQRNPNPRQTAVDDDRHNKRDRS